MSVGIQTKSTFLLSVFVISALPPGCTTWENLVVHGRQLRQAEIEVLRKFCGESEIDRAETMKIVREALAEKELDSRRILRIFVKSRNTIYVVDNHDPKKPLVERTEVKVIVQTGYQGDGLGGYGDYITLVKNGKWRVIAVVHWVS
jgi:hypothetical protein